MLYSNFWNNFKSCYKNTVFLVGGGGAELLIYNTIFWKNENGLKCSFLEIICWFLARRVIGPFTTPNCYQNRELRQRGGGQSAYHLTMILPFLAQRLFFIQISWNLKSVLSLGSYTWKNGQIRSAVRGRRFFADCFFFTFWTIWSRLAKKKFQQKFSPKKTW